VLGVAIVAVAASAIAGVWLTQGGSTSSRASARPTAVPTAAKASQPPALATTGDNWDQIMRSLDDYSNWMFEHPDPALVGNYATTDCPCFAPLKTSLADYEAKGQHFMGPDDKIDRVDLSAVVVPAGASVAQAQRVSLYVVSESLANGLIDSAGQVLQRSVAKPPVGYSIDLQLANDGRWYVRQVVCLGTPGVGHYQGCS